MWVAGGYYSSTSGCRQYPLECLEPAIAGVWCCSVGCRRSVSVIFAVLRAPAVDLAVVRHVLCKIWLTWFSKIVHKAHVIADKFCLLLVGVL